jgi:hypothetical protein
MPDIKCSREKTIAHPCLQCAVVVALLADVLHVVFMYKLICSTRVSLDVRGKCLLQSKYFVPSIYL